jgi:hypothetical protein
LLQNSSTVLVVEKWDSLSLEVKIFDRLILFSLLYIHRVMKIPHIESWSQISIHCLIVISRLIMYKLIFRYVFVERLVDLWCLV